MNGERGMGYAGPPDNVGSGGDWLTPPELLSQIRDTFGEFFDPCPYPRPAWDGLAVNWLSRVFVNPPYGREVERWFCKAITEISAGRTEQAIFLLHARTDTKWFHEYVLGGAAALYFVRGRIRFRRPDGSGANSPVPSIIAVFDAEAADGLRVYDWILSKGENEE